MIDKNEYMIDCLNISIDSFENKLKRFNKEINNIYYFKEFMNKNNKIYLYFWKPKINLFDFMKNYNVNRKLNIINQIMESYKFYFKLNHKIIDLNPFEIFLENKLFKIKWDTKLFNYKFKEINDSQLLYLSPENLNQINNLYNQNNSHKSDIWSLGIIFYELIHGKLPFEFDKNIFENINNEILDKRINLKKKADYLIKQIRYKINFKSTNNSELDNLLFSMLKFNKNIRINFDDCFEIFKKKIFKINVANLKILKLKFNIFSNYNNIEKLDDEHNYLKYLLYYKNYKYILNIKKWFKNNLRKNNSNKSFLTKINNEIIYLKEKLKNILDELILFTNNDYSNWEKNKFNFLYELNIMLKKYRYNQNICNLINFYLYLEKKDYINKFDEKFEKEIINKLIN